MIRYWFLLLFTLCFTSSLAYSQEQETSGLESFTGFLDVSRSDVYFSISIEYDWMGVQPLYGAELNFYLGNYLSVSAEYLVSDFDSDSTPDSSTTQNEKYSLETTNYSLFLYPLAFVDDFITKSIFISGGTSTRDWQFEKTAESGSTSKSVTVECPKNASIYGIGLDMLWNNRLAKSMGFSGGIILRLGYYQMIGDECELKSYTGYTSTEADDFTTEINDTYKKPVFFAANFGFAF